MRIEKLENACLIVVDMQNDFLPGGALEVPNSDTIIPIINEYIKLFTEKKMLVVYTRDWHPEDHISFRENGGIWPRHCVQNTFGAQIHPSIIIPRSNYLMISKAYQKDLEAYSGFYQTELHQKLQEMNIKNLYVCGVATEYCVKNTVLDALKLGYRVFLLVDAIKGVDLKPNDSEEAIKEMVNAGSELVVLEELLQLV
ncbi:MAG: bifunctional nicotinamidase/pyrazinamidase [bacterium]